jgi:hypothetical protein
MLPCKDFKALPEENPLARRCLAHSKNEGSRPSGLLEGRSRDHRPIYSEQLPNRYRDFNALMPLEVSERET